MRNLIIGGVFALTATSLLMTGAGSQTATPKNRVTPYMNTPLEDNPSREVRLQTIMLPPGAGTPFHRHPGDQWTTVQEGEVTYTTKGQTPRLMKAGDAVYSARGVIHRTQNLSDKPARTVEVLIVDKDKPRTEPVE